MARKSRTLTVGTSFKVKVRTSFIVHKNRGEVRPHLLHPYSTVSTRFSRTVWARFSRKNQAQISRKKSSTFPKAQEEFLAQFLRAVWLHLMQSVQYDFVTVLA